MTAKIWRFFCWMQASWTLCDSDWRRAACSLHALVRVIRSRRHQAASQCAAIGFRVQSFGVPEPSAPWAPRRTICSECSRTEGHQCDFRAIICFPRSMYQIDPHNMDFGLKAVPIWLITLNHSIYYLGCLARPKGSMCPYNTI